MCLSSTSHLPRSRFALGPTYRVTGLLHSGKRVSLTTTDRLFAFTRPLWRGSVWQIENGHRKLLKKVFN